MSLSDRLNEGFTFAGRLARRCREWNRRRIAMMELDRCSPAEVEWIAKDVGVSSAELCILAGKWPDSLDLLSRRLKQVNLDRTDIAQVEPQVLRDLQRVCTLCASKRKCAHDLKQSPHAVWEEYCPNASTLRALIAERGKRANT